MAAVQRAGAADRCKKKEIGTALLSIDELLAHALTVCGLTYNDFARLTCRQFDAVLVANSRLREDLCHQGWEQARLAGAIAVGPYRKKGSTIKSLAPFPWDAQTQAPAVVMSRNERKERIAKLLNLSKQ